MANQLAHIAEEKRSGVARFLLAMETVVLPPNPNPAIGQVGSVWSREDLCFLLGMAGEGYIQGMVPKGWGGREGEWGRRLVEMEGAVRAKMDQVRGGGGGDGGGGSRDPEDQEEKEEVQ